jgi:sugar (pentulose or hexulose) kinase
MTQDLLLAIDNGTQSARALLFDLKGNLVAKSRVALTAYIVDPPGWGEHDPEGYWQAVCQACQGLWAQPGVDRARIAGVAVTTKRGTVINVDKNGHALRPAITWFDQRRTNGVKPVSGWWGLAFKAAGKSETVAYLQSEAEANWISTHQPEIWRATHKYLLLSGYLNYRFTGRFVDSVGCQAAYIPFDYKRKRWAADPIGNGRQSRSPRPCCPTCCRRRRYWVKSHHRRLNAPGFLPACR